MWLTSDVIGLSQTMCGTLAGRGSSPESARGAVDELMTVNQTVPVIDFSVNYAKQYWDRYFSHLHSNPFKEFSDQQWRSES
jgi:hypothetical protein